VALLRLEVAYASHFDARARFEGKLPRNLALFGNPCLFGTEVDPISGHVKSRRDARGCGCANYVRRAGTPYLCFGGQPSAIRLDDPVAIQWSTLRQLSPHSISERWVLSDFGLFQRATQNGAHWIRHPKDAESIRRHFLDARGQNGPRPGSSKIVGPPTSKLTCGSGQPTPRRKGECKSSC
jgi:hypothetical protein